MGETSDSTETASAEPPMEDLPDPLAAAEASCRRAVAAGRARAAADLGLLLFRAGRRVEAMPWLEAGIAAGDARAQYLLGVALFNGDHMTPDPARARVLLRAAADAGIAQAEVALSEMGDSIDAPASDLLLSARATGEIAAQFARLEPPKPPTLEAMVEALLAPLLRERLEEGLPDAVRRAVERALAQPRPERS